MKVIKWLDDNLEEKLLSLILWAIVVIMFIQVIARYIFNSSLTWSEEVSRYLFIWLSFIGMSYCVKKGSHMRIDIIEQFFPKLKNGLMVIGDVCFLGFTLYMIGPGFTVIQSLKNSGQTSPAAGIPMYIVYTVLLVDFFLVVVRLLQKYSFLITKRKRGAE